MTRFTALLVSCCALLAAPATLQAGNLTLRVDGAAAAGTTFEGAVTLRGFAADSDRLLATGELSGALTDGAGERLAAAREQGLRLAVEPGSLRASCDELALRLVATAVEMDGHRVGLEPIELELPARAGGPPLRELLCRLAESLRSGAEGAAVARTLDAVLATLG